MTLKICLFFCFCGLEGMLTSNEISVSLDDIVLIVIMSCLHFSLSIQQINKKKNWRPHVEDNMIVKILVQPLLGYVSHVKGKEQSPSEKRTDTEIMQEEVGGGE